jgi:PTH1 family peptidyl-tRNA hydrolase
LKLVVGLGNPGRRYEATRHNVGFRVVERFAERCGIEVSQQRFQGRFGRGLLARDGGSPLDVGVLEPLTYMNHSGVAVLEALRLLPVAEPASDLLVVLDDVDLPFGRLRLRPSGGGGGHRGLSDVIARLGHGDFPRLRFGVGRPAVPMETAAWVLQAFSADEERALRGRVEDAADAVRETLAAGVRAAMNRFNADPASAAGKPVQ